MRAFALAAAAALMAGQAGAAIVTYNYTGQMMYWLPELVYPITPYGRITGGFIVDESLLPGGSLAGATSEFTTNERTATYSITSGNGSQYSGSSTFSSMPDWSAAGVTSYGLIFMYSPIQYHSGFHIEIGDDLSVLSWSGGSAVGGSPDPYSFGPDGYDSTDDARSYGPGTWTVEVTPAPVPLPAAAPFLLAGTAALYAVSRRRRA